MHCVGGRQHPVRDPSVQWPLLCAQPTASRSCVCPTPEGPSGASHSSRCVSRCQQAQWPGWGPSVPFTPSLHPPSHRAVCRPLSSISSHSLDWSLDLTTSRLDCNSLWVSQPPSSSCLNSHCFEFVSSLHGPHFLFFKPNKRGPGSQPLQPPMDPSAAFIPVWALSSKRAAASPNSLPVLGLCPFHFPAGNGHLTFLPPTVCDFEWQSVY